MAFTKPSFVHIMEKDSSLLLFNALSLKKLLIRDYTQKDFKHLIITQKEDDPIFIILRDEKFILQEGKADILLQKTREIIVSEPIERDLLYLIPTYNCNFKCKYCFMRKDNSPLMSKETLHQALDMITNSTQDTLRVVFFGGEPLLAFPIIQEAVSYAQEIERNKGKKINFVIISNGSLITHEIAQFIKKHNISITISIDGPDAQCNKNRVIAENISSFPLIEQGIKILQDIGYKYGASCTLTQENIDQVDGLIDFLKKNGFANSLILNPLHGFNQQQEFFIPPKQCAEVTYTLFKKLRKEGIVEQVANRTFMPFIREEPRVYHCSAGYNMLVVDAQGQVSVCHHFLSKGAMIIGNVQDSDIKEKSQHAKIAKLFRARSPYMKQKCSSCQALGLCGGGCPFESYILYDDINSFNEEFCEYSKEITRQILTETMQEMVE